MCRKQFRNEQRPHLESMRTAQHAVLTKRSSDTQNSQTRLLGVHSRTREDSSAHLAAESTDVIPKHAQQLFRVVESCRHSRVSFSSNRRRAVPDSRRALTKVFGLKSVRAEGAHRNPLHVGHHEEIFSKSAGAVRLSIQSFRCEQKTLTERVCGRRSDGELEGNLAVLSAGRLENQKRLLVGHVDDGTVEVGERRCANLGIIRPEKVGAEARVEQH
mmetsp:Transcript_4133/g.9062  ORF Transcript_4133/g.9062 Transcript_4133/m.9062 type:complete len:216 (-) Transcript_4133:247-894(-)